MLWLWPRASTTRMTGAPSRPATWAVEPGAGVRRAGLDTPVEKAHHPFDHGDVGTGGAVCVQRPNQLLPHQNRIQVATDAPGRQRVVARVDEVRADLERRDGWPACRSAPIKPVATVVFPLPDAGAATTTAGTVTTRCPSGLCGRRPSDA